MKINYPPTSQHTLNSFVLSPSDSMRDQGTIFISVLSVHHCGSVSLNTMREALTALHALSHVLADSLHIRPYACHLLSLRPATAFTPSTAPASCTVTYTQDAYALPRSGVATPSGPLVPFADVTSFKQCSTAQCPLTKALPCSCPACLRLLVLLHHLISLCLGLELEDFRRRSS